MTEKIEPNTGDWEQELQQALADLPTEPMPASLQRTLQRLTAEQLVLGREPWWRRAWLRPALACAVIAIPLALGLAVQQRQIQAQERQLAQAQQDLNVALGYLQQANERVASQVVTSLGSGVARPVIDTTIQVIETPLETTREYEL